MIWGVARCKASHDLNKEDRDMSLIDLLDVACYHTRKIEQEVI